MRALFVLGVLAMLAPRAGAGDRAEVRGRDAVWIDGAPAWRGGAVLSPLVWSQGGDAVAFAARDRSGRAALIVLLPGVGSGRALVLSWLIPRAALPARAVTWLGPTRLGTGPTELEPRMIASFSVGR
jgi:hypothetical protein